MNNGDHSAVPTDTDELRERLWAYDDFTVEQEHPGVDVTGAFASLGFLRDALKRSMRLWLAIAIIGLLAGGAAYIAIPPGYQATASVYVTNNPDLDPLSQIETDQALVSTRPVAEAAMRDLGIGGSVASFQGSYTAAVVTDQVLSITANGSTSAQAVSRAQAVAVEFLAFRNGMLQSELTADDKTLGQEVTTAQQQVNSLNAQISQLTSTASVAGPSATNQAKLTALRKQLVSAQTNLTNVQTTVQGSDADATVTTTSMVNGTQILDAATAAPHSKGKYLAFYLAIGLFGGLAVGMGFVIVRALVSDKLRRRGDIASALGIPVKLSTGPIHGRGTAGSVRRAVGYLQAAVPADGTTASLAIVAVDNTREVAGLVTELARACASKGTRVAIADLTAGAPAARQLGMRGTGVHQISVSSPGAPISPLVVIVPDKDEDLLDGPLGHDSDAEPFHPDLTAAVEAADVLITVLTLDPASGVEHLTSWATDVVVAVTARRSSAPRLYAVGELVRLAQPRAVSAIVLGGDPTDQSLGVPATPGQPTLTMPG